GRAREIPGNSLAVCPHSEHRRQRPLIQPAFHPRPLPRYAMAMAEQIAIVTGSWQHGQVLDVLAETQKITLMTLEATMFSDTLPPAELQQAVADMATVTARWARRGLVPSLDRLRPPGRRP